MGKKYKFDYIIIGSGPAGSTVALNLAAANQKSKKALKIAIVEGAQFGGSNLNTRDIPYGVSLGFSHTYSKLVHYPEISRQNLHFNFPTVVSHQAQVVTALGGDSTSVYEAAGITTIPGFANFLNAHTIAIGDEKYTSKNFILATGSSLKTDTISGLDLVSYLTPDTAIKVRRLPKVAFIIGGGESGCEIAEYFAELGVKVLIMEKEDRLLPREDVEVGETIKDFFTNELGVMTVLNSTVVAVEPDASSAKTKVIFTTNGGEEKMVSVDCLVVATGSRPATDYGLENAGVKVKKSGGVMVDKFLRTSAKNIYAVGDVLGRGSSSTERAEYEASVLVSNLIGRAKNLLSYTGFVRRCQTYPEVATVGLNEQDLNHRGRKYKKSIVYLNDLPASEVERCNYGFVKILADHRSDRILGTTIVAPNAGVMAAEFSIALRHRLTTLALASTPHIANSFNYAIKLAAKKLIK